MTQDATADTNPLLRAVDEPAAGLRMQGPDPHDSDGTDGDEDEGDGTDGTDGDSDGTDGDDSDGADGDDSDGTDGAAAI